MPSACVWIAAVAPALHECQHDAHVGLLPNWTSGSGSDDFEIPHGDKCWLKGRSMMMVLHIHADCPVPSGSLRHSRTAVRGTSGCCLYERSHASIVSTCCGEQAAILS